MVDSSRSRWRVWPMGVLASVVRPQGIKNGPLLAFPLDRYQAPHPSLPVPLRPYHGAACGDTRRRGTPYDPTCQRYLQCTSPANVVIQISAVCFSSANYGSLLVSLDFVRQTTGRCTIRRQPAPGTMTAYSHGPLGSRPPVKFKFIPRFTAAIISSYQFRLH